MFEWTEPYSWYHRIPINGKMTPGIWDQKELELFIGEYEFANEHVLDVGTLDGKWGFWALSKGARSVLSIDIQRRPTWAACHEQLGSPDNMRFVELSLEEFAAVQVAIPSQPKVDIVLDLGVYYHTEDLIGHFKALKQCLNPVTGVALIEGEIMAGDEPVAKFYKVYENGDATVPWVPTLPCLLGILESLGFICIRREVYNTHGLRSRVFLECSIA